MMREEEQNEAYEIGILRDILQSYWRRSNTIEIGPDSDAVE